MADQLHDAGLRAAYESAMLEFANASAKFGSVVAQNFRRGSSSDAASAVNLAGEDRAAAYRKVTSCLNALLAALPAVKPPSDPVYDDRPLRDEPRDAWIQRQLWSVVETLVTEDLDAFAADGVTVAMVLQKDAERLWKYAPSTPTPEDRTP